MDGFNKVLTGFLVLFVVVGLALYILFRSSLLQKIIPTLSTQKNTIQKTEIAAIKPTSTPLPTEKPAQDGSLFGWLFRSKTTPTPPKIKTPTTPTRVPSTADVVTQTTNNKENKGNNNNQPETIVIPYGSNTANSFPATGADTLLIPTMGLLSLLGITIKHRMK